MLSLVPVALDAAALAIFAGLLAAACVTDLRERLIPNKIPLGIAGAWLTWQIAAILLGGFGSSLLPGALSGDAETQLLSPTGTPVGPIALIEAAGLDLLAAVAVGGGLLVFALLFERLTGRPSMGGGDIKLLAACTLYLGLEGGAVCLMVACVTAIPLAAIIPRTRFACEGERAGALPFAPAIALGALVTLLL